jgi:DUF4097 and DUF4098 domain-containing protein YvlB
LLITKLIKKDFNFKSFSGSVEINNFEFKKAEIDVSEGNIQIQSTKTIILTMRLLK